MAKLDSAIAASKPDSRSWFRGARSAGGGIAAFSRARLNAWGLLIIPALAFLAVFFMAPMVGMVVRSFIDPGPGNYAVFVGTGLYARVLWTTMKVTLIVTGSSLLLGYPYAYVMLKSGAKLSILLGGLVLLPFWSSVLVRTYAWTVLLQDNGVINSALKSLGVVSQSLPLMRNMIGVTVGMTQILLPFMVFPVYAVMRRIDTDLLPAAEGLGARPWRAFVRVFAPLTLPGVLAGSLLVFVLSLGFYITPALLGSPSNTMYSVLVANMVSVQLRFGVASALGVILLAVTLLLLWIGTRIVRLGDMLGYSVELE